MGNVGFSWEDCPLCVLRDKSIAAKDATIDALKHDRTVATKMILDRDATIADLAAKLKRAVEVLKKVQWAGECTECPCCKEGCCGGLEHAPDCPLAAVLKENP